MLLVALLALAGGGSWLALRDGPSPVLRTTPVGAGAALAALDEWRARLYLEDRLIGASYVISTRTGALLSPAGAPPQGPLELANYQAPQAVALAPDGTIQLLDDRSPTPRRTLPDVVDGTDERWFLDEPTDMFYNVDGTGTMSIVDVRSGTLQQSPACQGGEANLVESHRERHLFVPCGDGSTEMYDARTGLLLRSVNTAGLGSCTCRRLADDATGRVFLAGVRGLGVLDARTGAVVRTLPIGTWPGGGFPIDAHAAGAIALDPRTGNIAVAPAGLPGSGAPAAAVLLLDGHSGAAAHRWAVPENPVAVLVNPLTGHLLVASVGPTDGAGRPLGNGQLSVLDVDRGTILRRIEVGNLPGTMLADRRTGHLFVVNFTRALDGSALPRGSPEGWWPQALRRLKGWAGWLPFTPPRPPRPPAGATVMMLDLTKL